MFTHCSRSPKPGGGPLPRAARHTVTIPLGSQRDDRASLHMQAGEETYLGPQCAQPCSGTPEELITKCCFYYSVVTHSQGKLTLKYSQSGETEY